MRGPIGTGILRTVELYLVRISCLVQFYAMSRWAPTHNCAWAHAHTLIRSYLARLPSTLWRHYKNCLVCKNALYKALPSTRNFFSFYVKRRKRRGHGECKIALIFGANIVSRTSLCSHKLIQTRINVWNNLLCKVLREIQSLKLLSYTN